MKKALADLDQALFGWGSPVTLGVFRAIFGTFALINWLIIWPFWKDWFTEEGFVPLSTMNQWMGPGWRVDLLANATDPRVIFAFYTLVVIAALCTALGFGTRIATIALAIGTITLHHRNPIILHGGDTVLRMGTIYLALAPCGRAVSLDRLIGRWKGTAPEIPAPVSLWPQRLLQIQLSIIYFTTVWCKWQGSTWRDGTATYYPPQLTEFHHYWFPDWFERQPWLAMTTYGTLAIELAVAFLAYYKPWRKWVLLSGLFLHASIEWRFNIPLFGFIIGSYYISHIEGHEISEWAKAMSERLRRWRVTVTLPRGASLAPSVERALRVVDPFELVQIEPGDGTRTRGLWSRAVGLWCLPLSFWWAPRMLRRSAEGQGSQQPPEVMSA